MEADGFSKELKDAIDKIAKNRNKIIEDYISFWISAKVEYDNLNPKWLADSLCLIERHTHRGIEIYMDLKK